MRQTFTYAILCAVLLAQLAGCRSADVVDTCTLRHKTPESAVLQSRQSPEQMAAVDEEEVPPFDLVEFDPETPSKAPPSLSLAGTIIDDLDEPVAAEAFEAIDVNSPASDNAANRWGHSVVASIPLEPAAAPAQTVGFRRGRPSLIEPPPGSRVAMEAVAVATLDEPLEEPAFDLSIEPEPAAAPPQMVLGPQYEAAHFEVNAHTIRVGDELEIKFPHNPLFSEKVMVQEDGMVTLPLIEPVVAAGMAPDQLQKLLTEEYRKLQYDPSAVRGHPIEKKYLLSVNDKLEIRFDTDDSESPVVRLNESVTIRPDGRISLPMIGTLVAEGKTPEELEGEVQQLYRQFVKEAEPVLIVREFTNNQVLVDGRMRRTGLKNIDDVVVLTRSFERLVFVGGEVQRPGFVELKGPMTVTQAIIAAGGPLRTAELRSVARFRESPDHLAIGEILNLKQQWTYDKHRKLSPGERPPVEDRLLTSNDVIILPKTKIAKVNDALEQYVYQLLPMTRNTSFQYVYTAGSSFGAFGF